MFCFCLFVFCFLLFCFVSGCFFFFFFGGGGGGAGGLVVTSQDIHLELADRCVFHCELCRCVVPVGYICMYVGR